MCVSVMRLKVESIVNRQENYTFPEILQQIRKEIGLTRRAVSRDASIPYDKLYKLEIGIFRRFPSKEIKNLAQYFSVSEPFLSHKCREYISCKKSEKIACGL